MAIFFFDSSAVVKRYIQETGTAWVVDTTNPSTGNRIYLTRITGVEVVSAISRQKKAGALSEMVAGTAIEQFRQDFKNQYRVIEVTRSLAERAMMLAETYALRGYDAVQLASGIEVHSLCQILSIPSFSFVSADMALNDAAMGEDLGVIDPNMRDTTENFTK